MRHFNQSWASSGSAPWVRRVGPVGAGLLLAALLITASALNVGGALAANPNAWPRVGLSEDSGESAPRRYAPQRYYDEEEARPRRSYRRSARAVRQNRGRVASRRGRAVAAMHHSKRNTAQARKPRKEVPPVPTAEDLTVRAVTAQHLANPFTSAVAVASAPTDVVVGPQCRGVYRSPFALLVANLERDLHDPESRLVEGAWPQCKGARHNQSAWQVASLGPIIAAPSPSTAPSLSGTNVRWVASANCLAGGLKRIVEQVAANFGPVQVNSTCRSPSHNRKVGGASRSYHLTGSAVDFRVRSHYGPVLAFLSGLRTVGGLKHYGSGVFHIDNGPRRTWGARSWGKRKHRRVRYARR